MQSVFLVDHLQFALSAKTLFSVSSLLSAKTHALTVLNLQPLDQWLLPASQSADLRCCRDEHTLVHAL